MDLYNEDGYPTEEALNALRDFYGTPEEFVDYATALYRGGFVKVEKTNPADDRWERVFIEVSFVTGGWSGAESVSSVIHDTLFHFAYWEMSRRGGLFVYRVSDHQWNGERGLLGIPNHDPEGHSSNENQDSRQ